MFWTHIVFRVGIHTFGPECGADPVVVKQASLDFKKDGAGSWKNSFFVLKKDGQLYVYKKQNDKKPSSVISLKGAMMQKADQGNAKTKRDYSWILISHTGSLLLATETEEEREQWMKILKLAQTPGAFDIKASLLTENKRSRSINVSGVLKVTVFEARGLALPPEENVGTDTPQHAPNATCFVLLSRQQAQTVAIRSFTPVWNEIFSTTISRLPCNVHVNLLSDEGEQKKISLGYVHIPVRFMHSRQRSAIANEPAVQQKTDKRKAFQFENWFDLNLRADNTMLPAAAEESYKDGAYRFSYGELRAGETLVVKIDGQINPPLFAGTKGEIALFDGEQRLGSMPLEVKVLP